MGIDIGMRWFHAVALDPIGKALLRELTNQEAQHSCPRAARVRSAWKLVQDHSSCLVRAGIRSWRIAPRLSRLSPTSASRSKLPCRRGNSYCTGVLIEELCIAKLTAPESSSSKLSP